MNRTDIESMTKVMAGVVRSSVEQATSPLVKRIEALEARPVAVNGKDGAPGRDGRDGLYVKSHVIDSDGVLVLTMSDGANVVTGIRNGRDGKDGAPGPAGADGKPGPVGRDGEPGKSVTLDDLAPLIAAEAQKAVAGLPVPKDGRDGVGLAGAMVGRDGQLVVTLTDGSVKELGTVVGKDGATIIQGKGFEPENLTRLVGEFVERAVAQLPVPKDGAPGKDGRDGIDGKDGAPGPQGEKGEQGPAGQDGAVGPKGERGEKGDPGIDGRNGADGLNGKDGQNGLDGKDGRDGVDGKDADPNEIAKRLLPEIERAVSAIPVAKGDKGDPGEKGDPGKDGAGIADAIVNRSGELVLTYDDGRIKSIGNVIGPAGKDGAPGGPPGPQGERGEKGDSIEYVGVHKPGQYLKGQAVTFGGSLWIAKQDTDAKPGDSPTWQLAVKKGRDAK